MPLQRDSLVQTFQTLLLRHGEALTFERPHRKLFTGARLPFNQQNTFIPVVVITQLGVTMNKLLVCVGNSGEERAIEAAFIRTRFQIVTVSCPLTAWTTIRFQSVYTMPISPSSGAYVVPITFPGTHCLCAQVKFRAKIVIVFISMRFRRLHDR